MAGEAATARAPATRVFLEVCCDTIEAALTAVAAGAPGLELCAALADGGVTPSLGLVIAVLARVPRSVHVNVLVRCRPGDFCYTDAEMDVMKHDVGAFRSAGVGGVVVGALTLSGSVDVPRLAQLVQAATSPRLDGAPAVTVTFSRAFDVCADAMDALDVLRQPTTGVDRLLTSGQAPSAMEGSAALSFVLLVILFLFLPFAI